MAIADDTDRHFRQFVAGEIRANNAILGLSRNGDGSVNVLAILAPNGQVHFILDVNGYFQ